MHRFAATLADFLRKYAEFGTGNTSCHELGAGLAVDSLMLSADRYE